MAKILVVDDEPPLREMVKEMLQMVDHTVDTAENASAALESIKKAPAPYDLMIIDRNMPGMTGVDAIKLIRANPKFAGLKILMLTAASVTKEIDEAFEAGANGYIIKPLNIKQLTDKVAGILKA
jgi:DNA-binding response OmpR family regulator